MSLGDTVDDLARQDVKGGIQAGCAVTVVVIRAPFNLAGLERQIQVQPDDIDHFICKMRIVADLGGVQPVRLKVGSRPYLPDLPDADPGVFSHQP